MKTRLKGMSLHVVLLIVSVVSFIGATMVALYLTNLNFTNAFNNGELAQAEAEAGLSEVVARLVENESFASELRATATDGANPAETFHVVTFDKTSPFPYSSNAHDHTEIDGYGHRTVEAGKARIISTGVCKGQTRTVEAIVEQPPYPFGLVAKGKITSNSPIVVEGTTGLLSGGTYPTDRPGHLLSNAQVEIKQPGTSISGYIQAVDTISVAEPATVRYGLRPKSRETRLPSFTLSDYLPSTFVEIQDSELAGAQVLDSAYVSHHDVSYLGGVELQNGLLYVEGNLSISGGVKGTGALIATGSLTIDGSASLDGNNWIAVLAGGDLTIASPTPGTPHYFYGIVYSEKSLTASDVVIVGSAIVNPRPGSPDSGAAGLTNVKVVGDQSAGSRQLTVYSSGQVTKQTQMGKAPFAVQASSRGAFPYPSMPPTERPNAGIPAGTTDAQIKSGLGREFNALWTSATTGGTVTINTATHVSPEIQAVLNLFNQAGAIASQAALIYAEIQSLSGVSSPDSAVAAAHGAIAEKQQQIAELKVQFDAAAEAASNAYVSFFRKHTYADGSVGEENRTTALGPFNFQINTFLPRSDRVRVTYCRITQGRI